MDTICNHYTIKSVLLADDDRDDHLTFHSALMTINSELQLERVSDGRKLLTFLNNYIPYLLLLDLDMPRKNGLECLKENRRYPTLNAMPAVLNWSDQQKKGTIFDQRTLYGLYVNYLLTFPLNAHELLD